MTDRSRPAIDVRPADDGDRLAVRRLLDAAVLAVDDLDGRLAAGDVLAATDDGRVVGTIVLDPRENGARDGPDGPSAHVAAIAVRRRRRDRGIGSALIEAAVDRYGRLTATFDADVTPFYASLGFEIEPADEPGRRRGVLE